MPGHATEVRAGRAARGGVAWRHFFQGVTSTCATPNALRVVATDMMTSSERSGRQVALGAAVDAFELVTLCLRPSSAFGTIASCLRRTFAFIEE